MTRVDHALEEIIYVAAVLDAEGYVGIISRRDLSYLPRIDVGQTSLGWLESLQSLWGGTISEEIRTKKSDKCARAWVWNLQNQPMIYLLTATRPYLRLKREQAELCLELQHRIDQRLGRIRGLRHSLTSEEREIRQRLYQRCRLLNRTGPHNDQLKLPLNFTNQLRLVLERNG